MSGKKEINLLVLFYPLGFKSCKVSKLVYTEWWDQTNSKISVHLILCREFVNLISVLSFLQSTSWLVSIDWFTYRLDENIDIFETNNPRLG